MSGQQLWVAAQHVVPQQRPPLTHAQPASMTPPLLPETPLLELLLELPLLEPLLLELALPLLEPLAPELAVPLLEPLLPELAVPPLEPLPAAPLLPTSASSPPDASPPRSAVVKEAPPHCDELTARMAAAKRPRFVRTAYSLTIRVSEFRRLVEADAGRRTGACARLSP
jgi:hypothetical protein